MTDKKTNIAIWLHSAKNFRRIVGLNGMLLPILLWAFLYLSSGNAEVLESISHYYYTPANSIFIGIMATLSMFLVVYNYKDRKLDFVLSCIAGIAAICVILFPTNNLVDSAAAVDGSYIISYTQPSSFRVGFHYVSAALFFLVLAYMSAFLFTKSNPAKPRSPHKRLRNRIYRVCAVLMVLSILAILLLGKLNLIPELPYDEWKLTFWLEVLAVESFGISWLVKGEFFFGD